MSTALRPLGLVKDLIESMKLDLTYAYDDLVFVEHNAFLFRFRDDEQNALDLLFNTECPADEVGSLAPLIIERGKEFGLTIAQAGAYTLTQNEEDETISLAFS